MIKSYIINLIGNHRSKKYNIHLGVFLAFVAGAINAGGFLYVGQYTSHMTGVVSSIADFLILKNFTLAFWSIGFLLSFIFGSAITAILVNWARSKKYSGQFAIPLLVESLTLLVLSSLIINNLLAEKFFIIILLCFIMGIQNATITKISQAEIRTTHMTGVATDLGIQIGKSVYKFFSGNQEVIVSYDNLKLHFWLITAFCVGGLIGAVCFKYFGFVSALPLVVIMFFISWVAITNKNHNELHLS